MGCEKRRYPTGGREADCHDLGIELLKFFELLSHLAEVGTAGDSGEVAQKNQHLRLAAEVGDMAFAAIGP